MALNDFLLSKTASVKHALTKEAADVLSKIGAKHASEGFKGLQKQASLIKQAEEEIKSLKGDELEEAKKFIAYGQGFRAGMEKMASEILDYSVIYNKGMERILNKVAEFDPELAAGLEQQVAGEEQAAMQEEQEAVEAAYEGALNQLIEEVAQANGITPEEVVNNPQMMEEIQAQALAMAQETVGMVQEEQIAGEQPQQPVTPA